MAGAIKMTPELTIERASEDRRDFFSKQERLDISRRMWARHDALNRFAEQTSLGFSTVLISGDKGWGKTLLVTDIGVAHTEDGYRVVHNFKDAAFGYYLEDIRDFYLLVERAEPPFAAILDEAHMFASKYGQGSHRNQYLQQTLSMSRKRGIPFYFVSQQENALSYDLRAEIDWLIYPVPPGSPGTRWNPNNPDFPTNLPPWCYMTTWTYGPKPWGSKFYAEQVGHPLRRRVKRQIHKRDPWRLLKASALYNTFETFDLGAAFNLNAAAMREAVEEGRAMGFAEDVANAGAVDDRVPQLMGTILYVYLHGILDPQADKVDWKEVADAVALAQIAGAPVEPCEPTELAAAFVSHLDGAKSQLNPALDLPRLSRPGVYEKMVMAYQERQAAYAPPPTPDLRSRFARGER